MIRYSAVCFLRALATVLLLSIIAFTVLYFAPGTRDLVTTKAQHEEQTQGVESNLNRSFIGHYLAWTGQLVRGNLGYSQSTGLSNYRVLFTQLPYTIGLTLTSMVLVFLLSISIGYVTALYPRSWLDIILNGFSVLFYSVPSFLMGTLLVMALAYYGGLFPISGARSPGEPFTWSETIHHAVLPIAAMTLSALGSYSRIMRASVTETLHSIYVRSARARGLSERTIFFRHILPNAVSPLLSWTGLNFATLVSSAFVIEYIFSWPGIGAQAITSAFARDYSMMLAIILLSAAFVVIGSVLSDLLNASVNARLRINNE